MAISNLLGSPVPLDGRVPIDTTGPRVTTTDRMLSYDATIEQRMWWRWAEGNFSPDDISVGEAWRQGLEDVDLKALGKGWRGFLDEKVGRPDNIEDAVARVDRLLDQPLQEIQLYLLSVLVQFLRAPREAGVPFVALYAANPAVTIKRAAPYAATVLRLYLVFLAAVAYELVQVAEKQLRRPPVPFLPTVLHGFCVERRAPSPPLECHLRARSLHRRRAAQRGPYKTCRVASRSHRRAARRTFRNA